MEEIEEEEEEDDAADDEKRNVCEEKTSSEPKVGFGRRCRRMWSNADECGRDGCRRRRRRRRRRPWSAQKRREINEATTVDVVASHRRLDGFDG